MLRRVPVLISRSQRRSWGQLNTAGRSFKPRETLFSYFTYREQRGYLLQDLPTFGSCRIRLLFSRFMYLRWTPTSHLYFVRPLWLPI